MARQEEVDIFMNQFDLNIRPEFRALDISAEFGETVAEMLKSSGYGGEDIKKTDELVDEFGDLYFALIALANTLNIDLDRALDRALEKYEQRLEEGSGPGSR